MVLVMVRLVLIYGLLAIMIYSPHAYAALPGKRVPVSGEAADIEDLKVVFLKSVTDFVTWPGEAEESEINKPFIIAIVGKTPITNNMKATFYQRTIKHRRIEIMEMQEDEDIPHCHLLFLARSVKPRLSRIIADLQSQPVLIIGDTEGYAQKGVHLNLYVTRDKLKYEINETAVRSAHLAVSYHLFKSASRIIDPISKPHLGGQ